MSLRAPIIRQANMDLLCIGSIVADFVFVGVKELPAIGKLVTADGMEVHPGGCATNTSIAFSILGGTVALVGRIGTDSLGDIILRKVEERGVSIGNIIKTQTSTAVAVVLVSSEGERTFVYFQGTNAMFSGADVPTTLLSSPRVVHLADTFLLPGFDGDGALNLLREAKSRGKTTSMDTSWDPSGRWLSLIRPHLSLLDFFFCGVHEAQAMTGRSTVEESAKALKDYGAKVIIIKMGEEGSFIQTDDSSMSIPALSAQIVDTTGAGDCYVAAFLFAFLDGWDYESSAQFATAAGAASVEAIGATAGLCSREHVLSIMKERPIRKGGF